MMKSMTDVVVMNRNEDDTHAHNGSRGIKVAPTTTAVCSGNSEADGRSEGRVAEQLARRETEIQHLQATLDAYVASSNAYEREMEQVMQMQAARIQSLQRGSPPPVRLRSVSVATQTDFPAPVSPGEHPRSNGTVYQGVEDDAARPERAVGFASSSAPLGIDDIGHPQKQAAMVLLKRRLVRQEQYSDDLETALRASRATVRELEHRLETATERGIMLALENESLRIRRAVPQ